MTCCSRVQVVERKLESRSLRWKPVHFLSILLVCRKFSVLYFTVLFAWDVCDQTASWWFWQYTGDVGASFVRISGAWVHSINRLVRCDLSRGSAGSGNDVSHDGHFDYFAGLLRNLACTQTAGGGWFSLIHVWFFMAMHPHWTMVTDAIIESFFSLSNARFLTAAGFSWFFYN